ncbi:MAG: SDR family NAD(P)-dependent oxidoreductase, partial [Proteobacteria bacterium]
MNLQNATVVVTGASSGIGRATALEFAKAGANVVLASRGVEALKSVAAECQELGAKTDIFEMDITEALDVRALAAQAVKAFNGRIDVWVNDPGIGVIGEFEKIPIADHDRVIQTNLIGYMHGLHAVLPYMKAQNA